MPTVVTAGPFRARVLNPPREHGPAHVHVGKGEGEVLVNLGAPETRGGPWSPVSVREVHGLSDTDVVRAVAVVQDNLKKLRDEWVRIHGTP